MKKILFGAVLFVFAAVAQAVSLTTEELPATDAVTGFDISFDAGATFVPGVAESGVGGGWVLQAYPLTGNGTVQVRAENTVGKGPWSDPVVYTTALPGKPVIIIVP